MVMRLDFAGPTLEQGTELVRRLFTHASCWHCVGEALHDSLVEHATLNAWFSKHKNRKIQREQDSSFEVIPGGWEVDRVLLSLLASLDSTPIDDALCLLLFKAEYH